MDTPASKMFIMKLGTGFKHAKMSNSTGSRYNKNTVFQIIDHIYYAGLNSRPNWSDTEMGLNELCAGLIDTVWNQSARPAIWSKKLLETAGPTTSLENLISNKCEYYPECDTTILWSDITDALRDTTNNKAPGADGIPSEVLKLAKAEPPPISALEKLIYKTINIIYDIWDVPQCL
ncbi:hypothetical protein AYI70_g3076 [Smittium culicis]|uniref:Transposon TX1 protein n=1 Tax=Smittium culicis TaxID=133412 RepID=A0A1R1Y5R6_9FUNG|nr:hypothetical protein AYI70_g3076 [Smittium culicis]